MDSRFKFIKITEEIFRQLGFDPPEMNHDEFLPLAMEVEIEKTDFELVHSTKERSNEVIILSQIEEIPSQSEGKMFENLMKINLDLARNFSGCFGVDPNSKKIIFLTSRELDQTDGIRLLEELRLISTELRNWINKIIEFNNSGMIKKENEIAFSLA